MMSPAAVEIFLSPRRKRSFALRWLPALVFFAALFFSMMARGALGADWNARVLAEVAAMPRGGGYAANKVALGNLSRAVGDSGGALCVEPGVARPSFCSGATYLVFLKTVAGVRLDPAVMEALAVRGQPDGEGIWGRWNANGPGTARLFRELGLGRNFEDFAAARPGDFMKIFWSTEVGGGERGHSVIFLGREMCDGVEMVRFWSSNMPGGYGEKAVPRSKIAYAIFSRLEHPEALERLAALPPVCPYLARLRTARSSVAEVRAMVGM